MLNEELNLREEIIHTCVQMNAEGINQGTSGNVSARWGDGILITPSALPYRDITPDDIVYLPFDEEHSPNGRHNPSSEWRFHLDILASRPDAGAVVHTHSTYATALAVLGLDIPAHHYMIAISGGDSIRCAEYAPFGTATLSHNALAALLDRTCCLLANHGVIATGSTLKKALWLAGEVEVLAKLYIIAQQIGEPRILSRQDIEEIQERIRDYGMKDH